jgi:hypothetical protein
MPDSPSTLNYYLGKGIVKIKVDGVDSDYRDVGNVPLFEVTPNVTRLEHYSSRRGIRFKDKSIVIQKQLTVKFHMEEWTPQNLAVCLMGAAAGSSSPTTVSIMDQDEVTCALRFIGTNEVGDKEQVDLPFVNIAPSAALQLIGETWGVLEVTGEVTADPTTGSFGTVHTGITAEVT